MARPKGSGWSHGYFLPSIASAAERYMRYVCEKCQAIFPYLREPDDDETPDPLPSSCIRCGGDWLLYEQALLRFVSVFRSKKEWKWKICWICSADIGPLKFGLPYSERLITKQEFSFSEKARILDG